MGYTVYDFVGDRVLGQGLDEEEALHTVLSYDGGEWKLVRKDGEWVLHFKRVNRPWMATIYASTADLYAYAIKEVAMRFFQLWEDRHSPLEVMTDERYSEMLKEREQ